MIEYENYNKILRKMKQLLSISLLLAAFLGLTQSQIVDYLDGAGLFTDKTKFENSWRIINSTAYSFSLKNETLNTTKAVEPYLYIEKNAKAQGSYDDGIFIQFGNKTPQHITFQMYTEDGEIETCDFRLTSSDNTTNVTLNNPPPKSNKTLPA
jgi:hypothetical protein